jgi:hypothetical protein
MKSLRQIAGKSCLDVEQLKKVENIVLSHGHYSKEAVREELEWFCSKLGMPEYYFQTTPLRTIAHHLEAVNAAAIMAAVQQEKVLKIDLATERKNEAIYLVDDYHYRALEVERRIERKYSLFRIQSYRTKGKAQGIEHLRMYVVEPPKFDLEKIRPEETDLKKIACRAFLKTSIRVTLDRYQEIIERSKGWETPLIEVSHRRQSRELRIMAAVNRESGSHFFSNISDVIKSHSDRCL